MLAKKYRSVSYISLPLIRLQVKQRDKKSLQRWRTVLSTPLTIMSPSPMRDLPVPHINGPHHRREAAPVCWSHQCSFPALTLFSTEAEGNETIVDPRTAPS